MILRMLMYSQITVRVSPNLKAPLSDGKCTVPHKNLEPPLTSLYFAVKLAEVQQFNKMCKQK